MKTTRTTTRSSNRRRPLIIDVFLGEGRFKNEALNPPREDADAAKVVEPALERDGVRTVCDAKIEQVGREGDLRTIRIEHKGATKTWEFDQILVGVGRPPNVEGIGRENAGVEFDKRKGVFVDAQLRTSNPKMFAVGDVAMDYKFTHMADATARIVIQNALFKGRKKHADARALVDLHPAGNRARRAL